MVDVADTTADNMATDLFAALVTDADFSLPTLDLTSTDYAAPSETDNPLYASINTLSEADLTSRSIGGSGMFDGLMASISAHLKGEYDAGRITSTDYTTAYVALTQAALTNAVQFTLNRDNIYWKTQAEKQAAQTAELRTVQTKLELEALKAKTAQQRVEANNAAANYALTKLKLASEETSRALGEEKVRQATYEVDIMMPKQVLQIQSAIEKASADISLTTAQEAKTNYEVSGILPAQKLNIEADTDVKSYNATALLPAQKANTVEDTLTKTYQKDFILPAQRANYEEQMEAHRAKTLDTRSDGVTPIEGSIGKQKDLHSQQITSYLRDAESKATKMLLDTWITRKTVDEGTPLPTHLDTAALDNLISSYRANLNLPYSS